MASDHSDYVEQNHHYVPRGYFKPWENADRRVVVYERKNGRVIPPYFQSTKRICVKPGLYAYTDSVKPGLRNVIEENIFQRIDSEAARVLCILNECENISDVSSEDMHAFAFFLASLRIRTPEFFENNARSAERRLRKLVADSENDPSVQDLRDNLNGLSFIQVAETHFRAVLENKGRQILVESLMSGRLLEPISRMHWAIISIPENVELSLLTSDRPFVSNWASARRHLLALPISPQRAIVASSNQGDVEYITHFNKRRFAEVINTSTVQQAYAKAFAVDKSHSHRFFERRLGTRHSTLPFAKSYDPELIDQRIAQAAQMEENQVNERLAQLIGKALPVL